MQPLNPPTLPPHPTQQVFSADRFDDGAADIALEPGLCAAYDAARATADRLSAAAEAAVEGLREGLRARGHAPKVLARVKLVEWKEERLLEVRRWPRAEERPSGEAARLHKPCVV